MPVQSGHDFHNNYFTYFSCKNQQKKLVVEGPDNYKSESMRLYIEQEVTRPCKQAVDSLGYFIEEGEAERVKLKTKDFILLQDVDCISKKGHKQLLCPKTSYWPNPNASHFESVSYRKKSSHPFHWLAVVADPGLRTLRDLLGHHVPLL